jgi:antitoxin component of MazEF toxin-antitoxin module
MQKMDNVRRLQCNHNRFRLILPKQIVELAGFEKSDDVKIEFCGNGKICLEKIEKEEVI